MLPTYETAQDEIQALFNVAWLANTPALNGGQPVDVKWPGVDSVKEPNPDKPYVIYSLTETNGNQSTFGPTGSRRFTREGRVVVVVKVPLAKADAVGLAEKLAVIARNAYEGVGTGTGIWFREARIIKIGSDGTFYRTNMTVNYEYDEQR